MGKRKYTKEKKEKIKKKIRKLEQKLRRQEEEKIGTSEERTPPGRPVAERSPPGSPITEIDLINSDENIPEDLLGALGTEGQEIQEKGEQIQLELATRWTKIMTEGLFNNLAVGRIIRLRRHVYTTLHLREDHSISLAVDSNSRHRRLEPTTHRLRGGRRSRHLILKPNNTGARGKNTPCIINLPWQQDCYRQAFVRRGTPNSALQVMMNSLSPNTIIQYDSPLRYWWNFCGKHNIDPYQASVPFILKFLSDRLEAGAAYGTLNTSRSALSLIINPNIGSDDRVKRFFRGVFRTKPPMPKYNLTWDPGLVLDYLGTQFPNENLELKILTKKLVTILALTTAHRVQTLALIKIKNNKFTSIGVHIKISDPIKTSSRSSNQPVLYLKKYDQKIEICPVNTLKVYMSATESLRQGRENLILTCKKPYKNASSQSISRWIKSTLEDAGIDVSVFSAHSTRHAATSAASRSGLNIDLIRKTAGWSNNSSVFARFYNRPVIDDPLSFSSTICDTSRN